MQTRLYQHPQHYLLGWLPFRTTWFYSHFRDSRWAFK
nr:MAG TPA: hypothetical protein [Caudoviricetes sp.]DAT03615.1 MAG TPA: hypothetical protein [Caudoviricetes sp.]